MYLAGVQLNHKSHLFPSGINGPPQSYICWPLRGVGGWVHFSLSLEGEWKPTKDNRKPIQSPPWGYVRARLWRFIITDLLSTSCHDVTIHFIIRCTVCLLWRLEICNSILHSTDNHPYIYPCTIYEPIHHPSINVRCIIDEVDDVVLLMSLSIHPKLMIQLCYLITPANLAEFSLSYKLQESGSIPQHSDFFQNFE